MTRPNSRIKDYFDLSVLLQRETLNADLLAQAIKATADCASPCTLWLPGAGAS